MNFNDYYNKYKRKNEKKETLKEKHIKKSMSLDDERLKLNDDFNKILKELPGPPKIVSYFKKYVDFYEKQEDNFNEQKTFKKK